MSTPLITIGKMAGAFGVRGWVRLESYTEPSENLFKMNPLFLVQGNSSRPLTVTSYQPHQKFWNAKFAECADRDEALAWRGALIKVARTQLPSLPADEYYWADLEGLQVVTPEGQILGHIDYLFETGANDVIVVKHNKELICIPYRRPEVVKEIDLDKGIMVVDWNAEG